MVNAHRVPKVRRQEVQWQRLPDNGSEEGVIGHVKDERLQWHVAVNVGVDSGSFVVESAIVSQLYISVSIAVLFQWRH